MPLLPVALFHPLPAPPFLPHVSEATSPLMALLFLPILLVLFLGLARRISQVKIGQWSEWGSWNACSSTCFNVNGVRSRKRDCPTIPPNCEGLNFEAEICDGTNPCQIT